MVFRVDRPVCPLGLAQGVILLSFLKQDTEVHRSPLLQMEETDRGLLDPEQGLTHRHGCPQPLLGAAAPKAGP